MAHVRWALNCRSNAMPCIRLLDSSAFGNGAWPEFLYYVWVECVFSLYVFPSSSHFISFIFVFLCKYSARQGGVFSVTCDSAPKKKAFVLAFSAIGFACWSSFLFFSVCVQKHLNANFDVAFDGASNFRHFFIFLLKKSCEIVYQTPSASATFHPPNITVGKNVARASHWRRNDGLRLHLADWSYVELDWTGRVEVRLFFWMNLWSTIMAIAVARRIFFFMPCVGHMHSFCTR